MDPSSPDLTPCIHFIPKYLEDIVYSESLNTFSELKTKSTSGVPSMDKDTFKKGYETWKIVYAFYWEKEVVISDIFWPEKTNFYSK